MMLEKDVREGKLSNLRVVQLRGMCKKLGVTKYSSLNKDDLVNRIIEHTGWTLNIPIVTSYNKTYPMKAIGEHQIMIVKYYNYTRGKCYINIDGYEWGFDYFWEYEDYPMPYVEAHNSHAKKFEKQIAPLIIQMIKQYKGECQ